MSLFDPRIVDPRLTGEAQAPAYGRYDIFLRPTAVSSQDILLFDPTRPSLGVAVDGATYDVSRVDAVGREIFRGTAEVVFEVTSAVSTGHAPTDERVEVSRPGGGWVQAVRRPHVLRVVGCGGVVVGGRARLDFYIDHLTDEEIALLLFLDVL